MGGEITRPFFLRPNDNDAPDFYYRKIRNRGIAGHWYILGPRMDCAPNGTWKARYDFGSLGQLGVQLDWHWMAVGIILGQQEIIFF